MTTSMVINLLIFLILLISYSLFLISSHPLIMGGSIILQAMMTSIFLANKMLFSWFSFLIFIVYLGGILMLFSYVISMINMKELFFLKNEYFSLIIILSMISMFFLNYMSFISKLSMTEFFFVLNYENFLFIPFSSSFKISVFMMIFLLLVMIVVIFLVESSKGMMRST